MDRVGGYADLVLLEEDERAYEDILIIMAAEAEAAKEKERKKPKSNE